MDDRRKRLLYRATHRGMKETDALIGNFAKIHLRDMSDEVLNAFETMLNESDNDLMSWVMEREQCPSHDLAAIVGQLITYRKSL